MINGSKRKHIDDLLTGTNCFVTIRTNTLYAPIQNIYSRNRIT